MLADEGSAHTETKGFAARDVLAAVSRLQTAHLQSTTRHDLLEGLARELAALTGCAQAAIAEVAVTPGGQRFLTPPAYWSARHAADTVHDEQPDSFDRPSLAAMNVLLDTTMHASQVCLVGDGNSVGLPLMRGAHLVGVVAVAGRQTRFDADLLASLVPALDAVTLALDSLRLQRDRQLLGQQLQASRQRVQEILTSLHDVAWSFSLPDGRMLYLSSGAADLYGRPVAELMDNPNLFQEMIHPGDREEARRHGDEVLRRGYGESVFRVVRPDGTVRWVQRRARVVYDESGRPVRVNGAHTDITPFKDLETRFLDEQARFEKRVEERTALLSLEISQRKQAEEALGRSEGHYRLLAEHATDLISLHAADGRFLYASASCSTLLGWHPAELTGRSIYELVHPDDVPAIREAHDKVLGDPDARTVRCRVRHKDGRWIWFETSCRQLPTSEPGEPIRLLAVSRDVSDRHRVEEALSESEARAHALEEQRLVESRLQELQRQESLHVLAGGVAHEFNNILTGLLGYTDLALALAPPGSPLHGYLSQGVAAAQRAAGLTRQMLAYSGKGRFLVQMLHLDELVRDMEPLLRVSISRKCQLRIEAEPGQPTVPADPTQVRQLVLTLLQNAAEAIGDREGEITITLATWPEGPREGLILSGGTEVPTSQCLCLTLKDTGCGMTPEVQAKMFDPFFTTKFTGRGLGLAAVRGIVRGHHGGILVESTPGEGTTIRVLFPVSSPAETENTHRSRLPSAARQNTILVVDDEANIRELARFALERAGHLVLTAGDGVEALEVFKANSGEIDAVLLDLTMPRMDGIETLKELLHLRPDLPVILSSGYSEHEASERLSGLGLAGFLGKPYRPTDLLQALRRALASV